MSLVSVIIPYRNRASSLERTLQSVAGQQYRPLQLILVDNGSTDGSPLIARKFKEKQESADFSIRLLSESRIGASAARNRGLQDADGKYTFFFDSDDEMSSDYLVKVVAFAEKNMLETVLSVSEMVTADGTLIPRRYGYSLKPSRQILTGMLSTQSMFFRTDFIRRIGGWDERLLRWNDWELGVRVLLAHPCAGWYREKAFHRIYLHPESITGAGFSQSYEPIMKAFQAVENDLQTATPAQQRLCRRSLAFRKAIMAALFYREGHTEYAKECWGSIVPGQYRFFSALLYIYTRLGGRGAWRIAARIV